MYVLVCHGSWQRTVCRGTTLKTLAGKNCSECILALFLQICCKGEVSPFSIKVIHGTLFVACFVQVKELSKNFHDRILFFSVWSQFFPRIFFGTWAFHNASLLTGGGPRIDCTSLNEVVEEHLRRSDGKFSFSPKMEPILTKSRLSNWFEARNHHFLRSIFKMCNKFMELCVCVCVCLCFMMLRTSNRFITCYQGVMETNHKRLCSRIG